MNAIQALLPLDFAPAPGFVFRGLDHYRNFPTPLVVNVSGGRSSAYQAYHFVEANGGIPDGVIFNMNNTGRERPEALDFADRLDRYLGLNLHWLEFDDRQPTKVKRVTYATAARNGEPFERLVRGIVPKRRDGTAGVRPLPNPAQRTCTAQLKIKTLHRYVRRHLGWPTLYHCAIGYRADEKARYERRTCEDLKKGTPEGGRGWFPMYQSGARESDILSFWQSAPFDLELDSTFGNCDFCFMASEWKIKERMVLDALENQIKLAPGSTPSPRLRAWIADEERESDRPGPYRRDRPTYRQMWNAVCEGKMEGSKAGDQCRSCTD